MRHVPSLDLGQVLGDVETVEILVPGDSVHHARQLHVEIVLRDIQPRDTLDSRQSVLHDSSSRSTNIIITDVQFNISSSFITRQTK